MHVPDGILSPQVCAVTGLVSAAAVGVSLYKLRKSLVDRSVPLTGMMSALIFAGQMVNFPLVGTGVSGHLIGGVLAGVVLGPWGGCLALSLVLLVQYLLFCDGGMISLGANILNMAVIGSMGGYAVYAALRRILGAKFSATVAASALAAWVSVLAAAFMFCLEFRFSHPAENFEFRRIFALMVSFHSLIGVGEAFITAGVVSYVLKLRSDLLYQGQPGAGLTTGIGRLVLAGMMVALAVAAFAAPFASASPDGLEAVAERTEFDTLVAKPSPLLLGDYEIPLPFAGWSESPLWQRVSVALAGLTGTLAVFAIALLFGFTRKPFSRDDGRGDSK